MIEVSDRIVINNGTVIRELAEQGVGVAMLPRFWVDSALRSGALVEALPGWTGPQVPLHAVLPHRDMPLAARVFVDHLRATGGEGG